MMNNMKNSRDKFLTKLARSLPSSIGGEMDCV